MTPRVGHDLDAVLSAIAPPEIARVLSGVASAALPVANLIRWGGLSGAFDAPLGPGHDGTAQKALDVFADKAFVNGLKGAGVRGIVSEERDPEKSDAGEGDASGTTAMAPASTASSGCALGSQTPALRRPTYHESRITPCD